MEFQKDDHRKARLLFQIPSSSFRRHSLDRRPHSEITDEFHWPKGMTRRLRSRPNTLAATKDMLTPLTQPQNADTAVIGRMDYLIQAKQLLQRATDSPWPKDKETGEIIAGNRHEACYRLCKDLARLISLHVKQSQKLETPPKFKSVGEALGALSQDEIAVLEPDRLYDIGGPDFNWEASRWR